MNFPRRVNVVSYADLHHSCVGWPSTYTPATKQFNSSWDNLVQYRSSKATVTACPAHCDDCQVSEGYFGQLHNFSFEKLTNGKSKNPRTIRKRKIPAGRRDRRPGEGGKRWASFTAFNIAKRMNKAAARFGCPVSISDPNNINTKIYWK